MYANKASVDRINSGTATQKDLNIVRQMYETMKKQKNSTKYINSVLGFRYAIFATDLSHALNYVSTEKYNRNAAKSYAHKWYNKKNNNYNYYTKNDCANFLSQCLNAGGISYTGQWHSYKIAKNKTTFKSLFFNKYKYTWKDSVAWQNVIRHRDYFYNEGKYGWRNGKDIMVFQSDNMVKILQNAKKEKKPIQIGDIVYFHAYGGKDIYHCGIITKIDANDVYYSAHSKNRKDYSLMTALKKQDLHAYIVRIKDKKG